MGAVWRAAIDSLGYSCEAESQPCGSSHLVVHYTKTLCVAAWQERRLAMLPKSHHSRFCHAGVFVPVVAQPIQDMSAMSITHKTVGIRLSRLWCGTVGMANKTPR